jgi:hypothetical protein
VTTDLLDISPAEGANATMLTEQMMAALRRELIVAERLLSREETKRIGLDDHRPVPTFSADRAVALSGAGAQINIGFEAHYTAVATPLVSFQHVTRLRGDFTNDFNINVFDALRPFRIGPTKPLENSSGYRTRRTPN